MKFLYLKYETRILRPVITVKLSRDSHVIAAEALIDSGADISLFDAEIAEALGLKLFDGRRDEIQGLSHGSGLFYYVHDITLTVGDLVMTVPVGFMPNMPDFGYGLLGQRGFFERCLVSFDRWNETIEIKSR